MPDFHPFRHYLEHLPPWDGRSDHILAMQVVGAGITQKLSPVYLGRALGEMGFRRVKYCGQRGYLVIERTAEEIRAVQRTMAAEAERDGDGQ